MRPLGSVSLLSLFSLALLATPFRAARAQTGILVVAHGSDSRWNSNVRQSVAQVRWDGPVGLAFLMGPEAVTSGWDSVTARLIAQGARSIIVVPLLVSSSGAHYRQIEHYAGIRDEMPPELASHGHPMGRPPVPMTVTQALDNSPEIGEALAERWGGWTGTQRARPVLLVAHGPESDAEAAQWLADLAPVESALRRAGLRGELRVALLRDDAAPEVKIPAIAALRDTAAALAARASDSVMVVPVMIADGPLTRSEIPRHLAGLPVEVISAGLTPHPAVARWIERRAATIAGPGPAAARVSGTGP